MFIGIIGGMDRQASKLVDIGRLAGHEVQCHTGQLNGGATVGELRTLIDRSDVVLIVTDLNSHNAVRLARRLASRAHRPARLVRRLGTAQFAALIEGWKAQSATPARARGDSPRLAS
jgi:4-hydroxy-3-methylbut-2-enyl diphosphate reductase IspH